MLMDVRPLKMVLQTALLIAILATMTPATTVSALQTAPGTGIICVLAYADTNQNHTRDAGEGLLNDVNASIAAASGGANSLIIANHVTDGKEPFCFPNL